MTKPRPYRPSALYSHIEKIHGSCPWGTMLDAGSGVNSLTWVSRLPSTSWTAVTASVRHYQQIYKSLQPRMREQDQLLVGNWEESDFLSKNCYDTVVADYLLGAVDGFAPYFQENMVRRLKQLTKRNLYIVGLEPYVLAKPNKDAGKIIWELGRLRDACLLLAGDHPYREYPAHWVLSQLKNAGFEVKTCDHFPIYYGERFINSQCDMCLFALPYIQNRDLAGELKNHIAKLRHFALSWVKANGRLCHGADYVIAAEVVA